MTEPIPVVDRITDAFFALDSRYRFTYLNERAQALLERPRGELVGRVVWNEFADSIETQFPDAFYRAMDEQIPVSFDLFHTRLETWYEARVYPSESGLSVFMRDITDRKRRETKLAQNAAVVEAIQDGVVVLDNGNRIVAVNRSIEREFGIDRSELVGDHVERLPEVASIDPDRRVEFRQAIDDVAVGACSSRELEVPFADHTGDDRIGEIQIIPIEDDRANVAGIIRDVTEQRTYEQVIESLHELTRWLLESDDPREICSIAVHTGSDLLELPISGVWLLDDTHGYLEPVAGTAHAHDELDGLPRFYPGKGIVWDVFEDGEMAYYEDLEPVEGVYNPETPIRSEVIAPIGTHGVLMTGAFEPNEFDETDLDLISTLVENTTAALDRAEQDRLLRERGEQLERQTDRLETIADILSSELKSRIERIDDAIEADGEVTEPTDEKALVRDLHVSETSVKATLDRTRRLIDDVREFAQNARSVGTRTRIELRTAIESAIDRSRLDSSAVTVESSATLRADEDRFVRLLEIVFDELAARSETRVTITVDIVGLSDSSEGTRGFYLLNDGSSEPISGGEWESCDPTAEQSSVQGLGLALARAIAEAHDWSVEVDCSDTDEMRIEFRNVTTLEPLKSTS